MLEESSLQRQLRYAEPQKIRVVEVSYLDSHNVLEDITSTANFPQDLNWQCMIQVSDPP